MMGYGYGDSGMMGGMLAMGLVAIVLVGAVVVVVVAAVFIARRSAGLAARVRPEQEPADIVRRRFASGEIGDEEYRRLLETLKAR